MMMRAHHLLVLALPSALPNLLRGGASVESHSLLQSKAVVVEIEPQLNSTDDHMVPLFQKMVLDAQEYVAGSSLRLEKLITDWTPEIKRDGTELFRKLAKCKIGRWSGLVEGFQQLLTTSAEDAKELFFKRLEAWQRVQYGLSQVVQQKKADFKIAALGLAKFKTNWTEYTKTMKGAAQKTRELLKQANASCHNEMKKAEVVFTQFHQHNLDNNTWNNTRRRHCFQVGQAEIVRSKAYFAAIEGSCSCDVQMLVDASERLESISALVYNGTELPVEPIPRLDAFFKLVAGAGADIMDAGAICMANFEDSTDECLKKVDPGEFKDDEELGEEQAVKEKNEEHGQKQEENEEQANDEDYQNYEEEGEEQREEEEQLEKAKEDEPGDN